jgi:hypothetical protein
MSRGCIWTLVGIGVTLLLLIIVVIAVPLIALDIVTTAPRVPVTTFITPNTVLALSIDPNRSGLPTMFAEGARQDSSGIRFVLPHELGIVLDVDATQAERTMTLMMSPRHLGPLIELFFGDSAYFSTAKAMDINGIDTWDSEAVVEESGALILRGHGTIDEADRTFVQTNWAQDGTRLPVSLEGSHVLELSIVNHDGSAVLAFPNEDLAPALAQDPPLVEDTQSEPTSDPAETVAAESDGPILNPIDVVRDIHSLYLTVDYAEPDLFTIAVAATCPNPDAAVRAQKALTDIAEAMVAGYRRDGVVLDGGFVVRDARVSGDLRLTGVRPLVVRTIRENMQ